MKGVFAVREVIDQGHLGLALKGMVVSGTLYEGMEARHNSIVIIIREIASSSRGNKVLRQARKGQRVLLRPLQTMYELLKAVEGQVLEFEDIRTVPLKEPLILKPDLT